MATGLFPVGEKVTEGKIFLCYNKANLKQINETEENVMKYTCNVCGWEYDEEKGYPEAGIAPGTKWEELPEDFRCPVCRVKKKLFSEA